MFGNPETTPGGRALKFYSSVRLDIRRIETLKDGVEAVGNRVRVKVVKNKVAPPFKQAEFDIIYGTGISWEGTVLDAGIERKVVQKSGSYFSFGDERLGQGRHNATAFLREHPDVTQGILAALQAQLGPDQVVSARLLPTAAPEDAAKAREEVAAVEGLSREPRTSRCARCAPPTAPGRSSTRGSSSAGSPPRSAGEALDDLERLGYLDDARTAETRAAAARRARLRRRVHPRRPRAARAADGAGAGRARAGIRAGVALRRPRAPAWLARRGFAQED